MESKKLPPLRPERAEPLDRGAGWEAPKAPRLEKASLSAGLEEGELAKLRLVKASLSPPNEPWVWVMPVGEGIPLIDPDAA